jgi:hypothetical protein
METNGLDEGAQQYHAEVTRSAKRRVPWTEQGLKIIRMRFLSDPGHPFWDVSYCHGQLPDGEYVNVDLPFSQLKKHIPINSQLVVWAKKDRLFLKGTGAFDAVSTLC